MRQNQDVFATANRYPMHGRNIVRTVQEKNMNLNRAVRYFCMKGRYAAYYIVINTAIAETIQSLWRQKPHAAMETGFAV